MSKPERIILIRHGESEGNVNKAIYSEKPDYALHLTEKGRLQAHEAGKKLSTEIIQSWETVKFYVSPFWRTRETYLELKKWFHGSQLQPTYEDPRLREQEWGNPTRTGYSEEMEEERDKHGHFYWRFPNGESCADVFDRMSDFMQTLHRDFEKENFARNVVIVGHGMGHRLFLMRWFHYTVEEFEKIGNPPNCGMYILEKQLVENPLWGSTIQQEKYKLITPVREHQLKHNWQFPGYTPLPKD
jgi:broad specificity phosphatase PhoE